MAAHLQAGIPVDGSPVARNVQRWAVVPVVAVARPRHRQRGMTSRAPARNRFFCHVQVRGETTAGATRTRPGRNPHDG
eukprot:gene19852-biopygen4042